MVTERGIIIMDNCKHTNNEGILQFEINQKQGQEPVFTCKLCKEAFTQLDVNAITERLL